MPIRRRGTDRLLPVRRRTLAGGVFLAGVLLLALTVAGVLGARHSPQSAQPPTAAEAGTRTANQPELEAALLQPAELPHAFSPEPKIIRHRPERPTEKCAALLGAPDELVRGAAATVGPAPSASAQAVSEHRGTTLLSQVLASFGGNGASSTFDELRRVGQRCRDFSAVLEDGTAVRVRVEAMSESQLPRSLLQMDGDRFALRLTLTGSSKIMTGYLALGRVGRLLSVLRQLEPGQRADERSFADLVEQASRKLLPLVLPPGLTMPSK